MMWKRMVLGILAAVWVLAPHSAEAQNVQWRYRVSAGGWIGITVDFVMRSTGGQTETLAVVTNVVEGSPSEAAGIHPGDTITHMDGQPVSQKLMSSLPESLEPGDLVPIVVSRGGTPREFVVEAAERPEAQIIIGPDAERMVVELSALQENILREFDSLRVSLAEVHLDRSPGEVSVHILRRPRAVGGEEEFGFQFEISRPFADSLHIPAEVFLNLPGFGVPFEALLVESRETEAVKEDLAQLRRQLTQVRRDGLTRRRELEAALPGSTEEALRRDEIFREIQAREAELLIQQQGLAVQLKRLSEEEMRRQWFEVQGRSEEAFLQARQMQEEALEASQRARGEERERAWEIYEDQRSQFRSPVIVGQSVMLGAQLAPLNPELAEYFPVDEGVFVVQVMEGTPASEAGLQGGDIIIAIAEEEVTTLSELRFGLSAFEGPLQIKVIRKGNPVDIWIRR
ncbi:MAG: PDZ domain-containing protein [Gemmatimonadetes bacterium]|nr:PDZ domain-containing protein [Gemmatimonadota bacterium]NNM05812.1 PDZ domain-containing protein [Gemmatimonadota bacterium]